MPVNSALATGRPSVRQLELPCTICRSDRPADYEQLYALDGYEVIRCRACDLAYVNRRFSERAKLEGAYWGEQVYRAEAQTFATLFKRQMARIESHVRIGRLLDVGCGFGYLLEVARGRGWDVAGVDINGAAIRALADKDIPAFHGRFPDSQFAPASFDVVTMLNLIEHLLDPAEAVQEAARVLRPGGLLVIETPSEDGFMRRAADLIYRVSGGRITYPVAAAFQVAGHHFGFSSRSLTRLLERSGFAVERLEGTMTPLGIFLKKQWVARRRAERLVRVAGALAFWAVARGTGRQNRMVAYARRRHNA